MPSTNARSASPISFGESSWRWCKPLTVISLWLGSVRQNSRIRPEMLAPGSPLMKSFGKLVPLRILLDDRHHILGHALYRQLARPYEGRKPSIAVAIRSPGGFHLFLGKLAQHASRKCYFDKHVLVENESFSLRRAKRPKLSVAAICIVLPSARKNDRLKIGDGFDLVWIAPGAEEADRSPQSCPIRVTFFVSCSTSSHASM